MKQEAAHLHRAWLSAVEFNSWQHVLLCKTTCLKPLQTRGPRSRPASLQRREDLPQSAACSQSRVRADPRARRGATPAPPPSSRPDRPQTFWEGEKKERQSDRVQVSEDVYAVFLMSSTCFMANWRGTLINNVGSGQSCHCLIHHLDNQSWELCIIWIMASAIF